VRIPVTVKMRIGVVDRRREAAGGVVQAMQRFDDGDSERLQGFASAIVAAGCAGIIVHARKAVLGGLSPHENRTVPPLRFDVAEALRRAFPRLPFAVNGGVKDVATVQAALQWCDSVMIGREAYHRPMLLAELQQALYPQDAAPSPTADAVLAHMAGYAGTVLGQGGRISNITRHMLGLVTHTAGAREYRRLLTEGARDAGTGVELLEAARCLLAGAGATSSTT
jgi:tRNA-dihydrouridine synthase A